MADSDGNNKDIRLACPFFARNPQRYDRCRSCKGAGWKTLYRLKEHLKKVHSPTFACRRCDFRLAGKPVGEHARERPDCKYKPREEVEYMTEKQLHDISKTGRKARNASPGEQWKVIFKKLFGSHVPVPPPSQPSLDEFLRIAGDPPPQLLSELQTRSLSCGQTAPFLISEQTLRFCLQVVVPASVDLVREHAFVPGPSAAMQFPQQIPQPFQSESYCAGLGHEYQDEAEDISALMGWQ